MTGPSSADRDLVAGRVQALLNVLASGDGASLKEFLPAPLGDDIPDSGRFRPLFVDSFGNDLINPSDNVTFTFFFDPNEITFLSPEVALAPVWTWLNTGEKLGIEIRLHKVYSEWFVDVIKLTALDLFQAALTGGAVPSSALWPMARGNRWQLVEIQAPPPSSVRTKIAPRVNAMLLNATRACLRTFETCDDPVLGPDGRQTFRLQTSVHESDLATSQLDLPLDPGTLEFGRFSNGVSAIEWGFIPTPSGAVPGAQLWDILDPARQGSMRVFEQLGLYLQGGDTWFNGGLPWRLTDVLVQPGAAAMQNITLSIPGRGNRSGEARIAVMEPVQVTLPWLTGLARRFDICLTWSGSAETTWTSLFFLPGIGLIGYADYDV
ncbi:hypothetical protein KBA41_14905, partial [Candidatus Ozemobacteraceae bacterium]|nr:hypothetical protein [Candidatus Ozemobacteraceae bacterium]